MEPLHLQRLHAPRPEPKQVQRVVPCSGADGGCITGTVFVFEALDLLPRVHFMRRVLEGAHGASHVSKALTARTMLGSSAASKPRLSRGPRTAFRGPRAIPSSVSAALTRAGRSNSIAHVPSNAS